MNASSTTIAIDTMNGDGYMMNVTNGYVIEKLQKNMTMKMNELFLTLVLNLVFSKYKYGF
jgi:hypothetical protein